MRALLLVLLLPLAALAQEPPRSAETITVERIIVDARVTEPAGDPILGLTARDFRVRVDGKPARIESVEWIPESAAAREIAAIDAPQPASSLDMPAPRGRLLIFFFQRDVQLTPTRITGQIKMLKHADDLLESLEPEDRVAVFSFDSHLKFRLDFSDDHERIRQVMREALRADDPPPPPLTPSPSLGRRLDREQMNDTAEPELALLLLGNALRAIPGPKSLILFGWGLGRLTGGSVSMGKAYRGAQYALESSRTSVYSLDITQADWHSLGVGLRKAAEDTGGFYAETYNFPALAIDRLEKTLEGHYELEVRKPATKKGGVHTIEVDAPGHRNARVMARRTWVEAGD